jgi:peptide/nickel transport system permease protein
MTAQNLTTVEVRMLRAESRKRALQDSWTLWKRNPVTIAGTLIILSLILIAMVAPWLATHDPFDQILADRLFPPSLDYWFGTDNLGRDIYSRVIHGSRLTLMIAFVVALISGPIGLVVGVLSGYLG